MMEWHRLTTNEVFERLDAPPGGLSSAEAARRLAVYGPNSIEETARKSLVSLFLDQFRDFMIVVLIGAAIVSGVMGELTDTLVIAAIVLLNAVMGFVQEYRAEQAMEALKKLAAPEANVVRDGGIRAIPADRLVPGDMVLLEAGSIVPADLRLLEAVCLSIDEASLTGESVPVGKVDGVLDENDLVVADRLNLAHKGTVVTGGRGKGVVVATGMATELGKIAGLLKEAKATETPLQRRLAAFGRKLSLGIMTICGLVLLAGLLHGEDPMLMFLTAVSLAVAAIPEALPAVVTVSLALGARRLAQANALVKKLPAVEALGSVTHICTDKTGTVTLNRMTVEELYCDGKRLNAGEATGKMVTEGPLDLLCHAMALCNDARSEGDSFVGDPTETALLAAARKLGAEPDSLDRKHARLMELPFDAGRKCMTTFHLWHEGAVLSFTKGAPEAILAASVDMLTSSGRREPDSAAIQDAADRMAAEGLRVLGFAMRQWDSAPASLDPGLSERELTFLGLTGMMDPPRDEAGEAVRICRRAGITPIMITGDHLLTARSIARRVGFVDDEGLALSGRELAALPLAEFEERVARVRVYARVAPDQKLKIVTALQDRGEFVAMTGDGVNDAPALKRADIGIAMGITGTDVSKEASDIILLDDNFATIVRAVREGRRIFDNIRKFIKYILTSNSGELWTIAMAPLLGLPMPLVPIQILWINLVTDGLPGIALAAEPAEPGIMERPPRPPTENVFAHGLGAHIIWVGLLMGGVSLLTQAWGIGRGTPHWQTMVFTVLCLSQIGHVLAIRSERDSLFRQGLLSNKPLLGAALLTFALQMAIVYLPPLNPVFRTMPLPLPDLFLALFLSSIVFTAVEMEKAFRRRRQPPFTPWAKPSGSPG